MITVVIPTTSFSENVVVAEASYEMLEVVSFCNQERAYRPSIKLTVLTFLVNPKYNEAFREYAKKTFNLVLVVVLVLELKSLFSVSRHIMWSHDKFGRKHPCKE